MTIVDTGGQERFSQFKSQFFKGTASAAVVFDLSRPKTFEKIEIYINEIRKTAGNIPIILVGNKSDLKESVGETVPHEKIVQMMNQHNLFEYIETSALQNKNVDNLFNRMAVMSLLDLRPRLGEIQGENHFLFKVLLSGSAAVGKSTLIKTFIDDEFTENYQLTIGVDFMTHDFKISNEELPEEVRTIIIEAVEAYGGKIDPPISKPAKPPTKKKQPKARKTPEKTKMAKKVKPSKVKQKREPKTGNSTISSNLTTEKEEPKVLTNNLIYLVIACVIVISLIALIIHLIF